MSRTRIVVNLIDADGCTFNTNYRQRLLHCIAHYGHIIENYGNREALSAAEQEVLSFFIKNKILKAQKKLSIKSDEYRALISHCENKAKRDRKTDSDQEENKAILSRFIYKNISLIEKIYPSLLRQIYCLANATLISRIKKQSSEADQVIMMLGSNRQCYVFDEHNCQIKGTSSIYRELNELANQLKKSMPKKKIWLDKFTLADLYDEKKKSKDNYKNILNGLASSVTNAFDNSKINIIYACSHRIAKKYEDTEIVINMWDDVNSILQGIKTFFVNHLDLLPSNVKLNLHHYDGKIKSTVSLHGTGMTDYNYKQNTVLMASMCGFDNEKRINEDLNIAENLDVPAFIQARKTGREFTVYSSTQTLFQPKPAKLDIVPVEMGWNAVDMVHAGGEAFFVSSGTKLII